MSDPLAGKHIGAFRIERLLGGGAFKKVYAATNTAAARNGLPAHVALCVPHAQDAEARRLLANELKIIQALRHPAIVEMYAVEEADGMMVAAMELIEGETLAALLEREGPQPFERTLAIARQVGEALDFAHDALAIHRDIKPANIMLRPDGSVKVLDFGLARLMAHSQYHAVSCVGTMAFMAPEQFEGSTGLNSDLWSLGLTFCQLLTNTHPFASREEASLMRRILYEAPDLTAIEHGSFDPRLVGVLRKALQKDPAKRYQRAAAFIADLEAIARRATVLSQAESRLESLLRAHFPLVAICSHEEERVLESLRKVRDAIYGKTPEALHIWSETRGLRDADGRPVGAGTTGDPVVALRHVVESAQEGLYVFLDLHRHYTPVTVRLVRDAVSVVKRQRKSLLIVSPVVGLPPELQGETTLFFFDPPELEALKGLIENEAADVLGAQAGAPEGEWRDNMAAAVLGLTRSEAQRTVRRALLRRGQADRACIEDVFLEKRQAVRKSGVLEHCVPGLRGTDVGGLGNLKAWFAGRREAFTAQGRRYGLRRVRGTVLVGVPGCGKSLSAKALAGEWCVPLLRLDMGRIYGSLVGQSESRLRQALQVAEHVSPCVLWIDELEKAFAGLGRAMDGGVTQRVFGTFLNWLSDHDAPVFVVATANDISKLPPEFTRAGRFDAVFFVDLPAMAEREAILRIHLARRQRAAEGYNLKALAELADGFSGAELEDAVVNGLYRAFEEGQRTLTDADIAAGLKDIVPLSRSRAMEIAGLRIWAQANARPA